MMYEEIMFDMFQFIRRHRWSAIPLMFVCFVVLAPVASVVNSRRKKAELDEVKK